MKKLLFILVSLILASVPVLADNDPMQPVWNFSTLNGIVDENGDLLPGRPNPYVPGAIIHLIQTQDDIIDPPDENGNPTGDDTLFQGMKFYIGQGIPPFHSEPTGSFSTKLQPMPQGKVYARIFNQATIAESTYYGETNIVVASEVESTGLDYYFYVDEHGLTQTDIPFGEPSTGQPPVADAGGPYTGSEGHGITLNASLSYDPDNSGLVSYSWDTDNDGEFDDASGITVEYTWTDETDSVVRLQVSDNDGLNGIAETIVTVYNAAPVIEAIGEKAVKEGDTLVFEVTFVDDGIYDIHAISIDWDNGYTSSFGFDDNVASPFEISFRCMDSGQYNPVITVYDNDGASSDISFSLDVTAQPLNPSIHIASQNEISLIWDAVPDKEYDIFFRNSLSSMDWQQMAIITGNAFADTGDSDGFDNIPGTPDDRPAPSAANTRIYKIIPRKFY